MDEFVGDSIEIKNLKVGVRVGITDKEISKVQEVSISLRLVPGHSLGNLDDDITRTVDYYAVTERVKEVASSIARRLIETLAEDVANMLLAEFDLVNVAVDIRKFILPDTDYVAVRLVRQR
jgi:FolB domain-containing protein